jgi:hypothetical protein
MKSFFFKKMKRQLGHSLLDIVVKAVIYPCSHHNVGDDTIKIFYSGGSCHNDFEKTASGMFGQFPFLGGGFGQGGMNISRKLFFLVLHGGGGG